MTEKKKSTRGKTSSSEDTMHKELEKLTQALKRNMEKDKPARLVLKQYPHSRELVGIINGVIKTNRELHKQNYFFLQEQAEWKEHSLELEMLQEISRNLNTTHELPKILEVMAGHIDRMFDSDGCVVYLMNDDTGVFNEATFCTVRGQHERQIRRLLEDQVFESAIQELKPGVIPHIYFGDDFTSGGHEGTLVPVPLWVRNKVLGLLIVLSRVPRHSFFDSDLDVLSMIANAISVALENALLYDEMEKKINSLSILLEASKSLSSILNVDELLENIIALATQVASWKVGYVALYNEETKLLEPLSYFGIEPEDTNQLICNLGENITGWVAERRTPIFITRSRQEEYFPDAMELKILDQGTMFSLPMESKTRVIGVLNLFDKRERLSQPDNDQEMIQSLATLAAITLENARLYREKEQQAVRDELTGLYNARFLKRYMDKELEYCKSSDCPLVIMILDIDNFKELNDKQGYRMGSFALKEVARILEFLAGKNDVVFHYGGDKFFIAMSCIPFKSCLKRAERIRKMIETYSFLKDYRQDYHLTISIGIAAFPRHAKTTKELLQLTADLVNKAKDEGKNKVQQPKQD